MKLRERPAISYRSGKVTRVIRIASLIATAAIAVWGIVSYFSLPETVPTHFNAAGEADAYGSRSSVLVLVAVFVVLQFGVAWLSTKPKVFNFPVELSEQNAQQLYRAGEQMLVWLMAPMVVLFFTILEGIVLNGALSWLTWIALAALMGISLGSIVRMIRYQ